MFQFHKVRLKVVDLPRTLRMPAEFQFHKVRLKDDQGQTLNYFFMFQFHKVRLKEGLL